MSKDFQFTVQEEGDEPLRVVPFPVLDPAALYGLPGKIVTAVAPFTEAHPAAMLVQLLAYFGATVGTGPHMQIGNREHAARLYPLIVGKTSDGAKGTGYEVVRALFADAEAKAHSISRGGLRLIGSRDPIRRVSGLSSGEGLIEAVRDENGSDPNAKGFDEGVIDKRLLVVEQEFTGMLAVMKREGSILPRIVREAWDGEVLRTMKKSPMMATGAHIVIIGHVTPGEFTLRLKDVAQLVGGTLNRFLVVASRRTKLLPDGGNLPPETLEEYGTKLAEAAAGSAKLSELQRTAEADELWRQSYADLRRARPDGPVAQILARCAPQVLRLALAYTLADCAEAIDYDHLRAALAVWSYVEATAEWLFSVELDTGEVDGLVGYIAAAGREGRTRAQISSDHFKRNKTAAQLDGMLGELIREGRVRQETDRSRPGRPVVGYFAC